MRDLKNKTSLFPTACAILSAFVLTACGRIGYELLEVEDTDDVFFSEPDGSMPIPDTENIILFHSNRAKGNYDIYLSEGDGSAVRRLTANPGQDRNPQFSPDGEYFVFDSNRDGNREIYMMRRDGHYLTRLTNNHAVDEQPSFSPDGREIVFVSNRDGNREIYRLELERYFLKRITNNSKKDEYPVYAPDGTRIFFISTRDDEHGEIYSMSTSDGTRVMRLTYNSSLERSISVSPDGTRLVFSSNLDGNYEIYTIDAQTGSDLTRLTQTRFIHENWPTWAPDRDFIYYSACKAFRCNVFSMESDGSHVVQLTDEALNEHPSSASVPLIDIF